jgi:hypothetical protein
MEMIWLVLCGSACLGLALLFVLLCVQYTGQWSFGNRLMIVWTRFNTLVLLSIVLALAWSSLVASGRFVLLSMEQYARPSFSWNVPSVFRSGPARPVAVSSATGDMSVLGGPSLSADFVDQVLSAHESPAAGTGEVLYSLSQQYGIDDAFALAFFWHESNFGRSGEAARTHSLGNLRCFEGAVCIDQDRGGYASFPDWSAGYTAWYALIAGSTYIGAGRTTVQSIIPVYAPTADHNDESAYIAAVVWTVERLRAGQLDL